MTTFEIPHVDTRKKALPPDEDSAFSYYHKVEKVIFRLCVSVVRGA